MSTQTPDLTAGFVRRPPNLTAGFVPKPHIGQKDPESGRTVLQPTESAKANQALATHDHEPILAQLHTLTEGIPGAKVAGDRDIKPRDRTKEKIQDEGQPAETIPDYSGYRVSVDHPKAKEQTVSAIRESFPVVKEKDEFDKGSPEEGFHAHMMQVQGQNGATHEVQILPKETADIAESTHDLYEKARSGDKEAQGELKSKNADAWQKYTDRNSSGSQSKTQEVAEKKPEQAVGGSPKSPIAKGSAVVMNDGTRATVAYAPPESAPFAKYRAKTDDGKEVTFSPRQVKTGDVVSGAQGKDGKYTAVDLDGTLAKYDGFKGATSIGEPIPAMVDRVKQWISDGQDVRIFTARVNDDKDGSARRAITQWAEQHIGQRLPVTNIKDPKMEAIYDDRAIGVERNTGKLLSEPKEG